MHVRHEQVGPAVVVVVEKLDSHRTPGGAWEHLRRPVHEPLAVLVLEIVIAALHVQRIEIREAVAVHVRHARITAPTGVAEAHGRGHILEAQTAKILVQDRGLRSIRMEVAGKPVRHTDKCAAGAPLVGRIVADIADVEIHETVAIEVEEHNPGRMADVIDASGLRDVAEMALAVVLEQHVAAAHGGDERDPRRRRCRDRRTRLSR